MPLFPASIARHDSPRVSPTGEIAPMPVTTTRLLVMSVAGTVAMQPQAGREAGAPAR